MGRVFASGLVCALGLGMLGGCGGTKPPLSISISPASASFVQQYTVEAPQLFVPFKVTRSDGAAIAQITWKSTDACVFIGSDPNSPYANGGCNKTCGGSHTATLTATVLTATATATLSCQIVP